MSLWLNSGGGCEEAANMAELGGDSNKQIK